MRLGYPTGKIVRPGQSGGADLDFRADITWAIQEGVAPVVAPIYMDRDEAKWLADNAGEVELHITYPNADGNDVSLVAKKVYVLGLTGSTVDFTGGILLADQRVWWNRNHIKRRYNIRTRSGDRRRLDIDGELFEQVAQVVDDITYKKYSLWNGRRAWKAWEIAEDVLNAVIGEGAWRGDLRRYAEWASNLPNDVEIDDDGDNAIGRVLNYLPGAAIYVSLDGFPTVYNTLDVEAASEVLGNLDGFFNEGEPAFVDLKHVRPEVIDVLLTPEQEVRFDVHKESPRRRAAGPAGSVQSGGDDGWKDIRFAENVIPIPDPSLVVNGTKLVQGTWVTIDDIIPAWNADAGGVGVTLSREKIDEYWVMGILEMIWGTLGLAEPNVVWVNRLLALREHYNQTFRINPFWIQKVYSFRPYRVALLDPETGSFARSTVYTDYTVQFSYRGGFIEGVHQDAMQVIEGGVEPDEPLSSAKHPSEAMLEVMDQELGIVRYNLRTDLLQQVRNMIPGVVEEVGTLDPRQWKSRSFYNDGTRITGKTFGTRLASRHRCSFIVTMAPGMPNDDRQLYRIPVNPGTAQRYIPGGRQIGRCLGPKWEVRVGPQMTTARFAWSHSKRSEIERSMGITDFGGDRSKLKDLLQNPEEVQALAEVLAAGTYASYLDRWEGRKTGVIDPDLAPAGTINRVEWTVSARGGRTSLQMPSPVKTANLLGALPTSARQVILKEVQPNNAE